MFFLNIFILISLTLAAAAGAHPCAPLVARPPTDAELERAAWQELDLKIERVDEIAPPADCHESLPKFFNCVAVANALLEVLDRAVLVPTLGWQGRPNIAVTPIRDLQVAFDPATIDYAVSTWPEQKILGWTKIFRSAEGRNFAVGILRTLLPQLKARVRQAGLESWAVGSAFNARIRITDPNGRVSPRTAEEIGRLAGWESRITPGFGVDVFPSRRGLYVARVGARTPAARADLRVGDEITAIDGEELANLSFDERTDKIVAPDAPLTNHRFKFLRRGKVRFAEIPRETIQIKNFDHQTLNWHGHPGALITIGTFLHPDTFKRVAEMVHHRVNFGAKFLVFDHRFNLGGYNAQFAQVASLFLPDRLVLAETHPFDTREGVTHTLTGDTRRVDVPVILLVNRETASAAELFTNALQLRKRAVVVGERTFGKGTMQVSTRERVIDGFDFGRDVTLYRTKGQMVVLGYRYLDGIGVIPDVPVNLPNRECLLPRTPRVRNLGPDLKPLTARFHELPPEEPSAPADDFPDDPYLRAAERWARENIFR